MRKSIIRTRKQSERERSEERKEEGREERNKEVEETEMSEIQTEDKTNQENQGDGDMSMSDRMMAMLMKMQQDLKQGNENLTQRIEQSRTDLGNRINETNAAIIQINERFNQQYEKVKTKVVEIEGRIEKVDDRVNVIAGQLEDTDAEVQLLQSNNYDIETQVKNLRETVKNLEETKGQTVVVKGWKHNNIEEPLFSEYKKVPMEFIQRIKEYFVDITESNWGRMKMTLDQCFKGIHDHWWGSARDDIQNLEDFIQRFKGRYWSEIIQGRIREDISSGKYECNRGLTPSAYFLGKVRSAKHLEPPLPESMLVKKLSYHFHECIYQAHIAGHINTIEGMEAILNDVEPQRISYQRPRWNGQPGGNKQPSGNRQQEEERPRGNYNREWQGNSRNFYNNQRTNEPQQRERTNNCQGRFPQNQNYQNNRSPKYQVSYITRGSYPQYNRRRSYESLPRDSNNYYRSQDVRVNNYHGRRRSAERYRDTAAESREQVPRPGTSQQNNDERVREPILTTVYTNRAENEEGL